MRLDSVRALKRELYRTVVPIVRRAMTLALAGRRASAGPAPEPTAAAGVKHVALGIAPAGPKDFRLAVRRLSVPVLDPDPGAAGKEKLNVYYMLAEADG